MFSKVPRGNPRLPITGERTRMLDKEGFSLKIEKHREIVTFSREKRFELMGVWTTVLSDGTFKSAPKLFYQLYIVFGVVDDRKLPVSWVLLKNKTTETYCQMLQFLKKELQRRNLQLTATEVVCGFGLSFKSAKKRTNYLQFQISKFGAHISNLQKLFQKR